MIDLHSHILPGMDDGSPDAETSMQMLRQMAVQGVTSVCASSHYYADENSVNQFCTRRQAAWAQLQAAGLGQHADQPTVLLAAEVAYFPCISECKDLPQLCIEGTRTLLLDMPFCEWNDFQVEEVTALTLDLGYQLVLVHPERFLFSKNNRRRLERLMELPIGLQVNAGSLLHWQTRKTALHILRETDCPLLGSDAHNLTTRPPNIKEGRSVIEHKLGAAYWQRMQQNAARMLGRAFANV